MSRPLAVLRPEPGNAATAAAIAALGHRVLRLPLFAVTPVAWRVPDPARYDALLLTSANAVRHGGAGLAALAGLPVHAVGAATAEAARAAGFAVASVGDGGVDDVAIAGRVLHLAGREHRARPGVESLVVYASDPLAPDLAALDGAVALVHSRRAAARLAELTDDRVRMSVAAIGDAAARMLGTGWHRVATAAAPTDAALIAAAVGLAD